LGLAYTSYGFITIADFNTRVEDARLLTLRCGVDRDGLHVRPHHLIHGVHILSRDRRRALDLFAVAVGFPAASCSWASASRPSSRSRRSFRRRDASWVQSLPTLAAVYVTILAAATLRISATGIPAQVFPNLALVALYFISATSSAHPVAERGTTQGGSLSGSGAHGVFPTCGLMHGVYAMYLRRGDTTMASIGMGFVIDWLAVPAGSTSCGSCVASTGRACGLEPQTVRQRAGQEGRGGGAVNKILVIDDQPDIRELLKTILSLRDFEVAEAAGGPTRWRLLDDGDSPDLILLDVRCGDGRWEALTTIRVQVERLPHVAVGSRGIHPRIQGRAGGPTAARTLRVGRSD